MDDNPLSIIENKYFDLMDSARLLYMEGEADDARKCEEEARKIEPEMNQLRKTHGNYRGTVSPALSYL